MSLTIGLDRKSPIPLESNPRRFEGLIERHGQWVRWSIARKCTCLLENNRPDARCVLCRGSGWRYSFQMTEDDIDVSGGAVDANTIEMPYDVSDCKVSRVTDTVGQAEYKVTGVYGKWIKVEGTPFRGRETVLVALTKPRTATVPADAAVYAGHGIVQLDQSERANPWSKVPHDLIAVRSVKRADGSALSVLDFSVDKVIIDTEVAEPAVGERLTIDASYMPPFRMAIISQNLSQTDRNFLQNYGGDAMCVFPFSYKVGEYDPITVWAGTQVRKRVVRRALSGDTDTLPDLFVSQVLVLADATKEYVAGVDFVLWDRNTIRWLVPEGQRPAGGAYFSIEYMGNVTYRVLPQLPNVRSSEDKRFPSHVAVKLDAGTSGGDQI